MKKTILSLLFAALWSVCAYAQVPMNGLVAYYGFENNFNSHNGIHNLTSANTNGTSSVGYTVGAIGQGAYFDGSCALVNTAISQLLTNNPGQPFTISFWGKMPAANRVNQYNTAFEIGGSFFLRSYNFSFLIDEMGHFSSLSNQWVGGTLAPISGNSNTRLHHYTIAYNPANQVAQFYLDGTLQRHVSIDVEPILIFNNVFTIGGGTTSSSSNNLLASKCFEGMIDEFYIYDRTLSGIEAMSLYSNNQSPSFALPSIVSTTHSNILATSANINISAVAENNLTTAVQVKYGTSATNLNNTISGTNISGFSAQNQTIALSNLLPNQTYYYQVEATNVLGTTSSAVQTFKTISIPPIVYNVSHSDVRDDSATINYAVNTSNAATSIVVKYGTSASNLNNTRTITNSATNTVTGAYVITGLNFYTTYYYQVVANNNSGTSMSPVYSFRTLYPTNSPTLPRGYRVGSKSAEVSVYPNPATDVLNVALEQAINLVEIIDLKGKILLVAKTTQINVNHLPAGTYMARVTDANGKVSTHKFNKQ